MAKTINDKHLERNRKKRSWREFIEKRTSQEENVDMEAHGSNKSNKRFKDNSMSNCFEEDIEIKRT